MAIAKNKKRKQYKNMASTIALKARLRYEIAKLKKEKDLAVKLYQQHIAFYDLAPSGYLTIDKEGKITYANQSAATFFWIDLHLLIGKRLSDFIDEDSIKLFEIFLSEMSQSFEKKSCSLAVKTPTNTSVNVHFEGVALANGEGYLIDVVDIIGRIKLLDQILDGERKYQNLLNSLNVGVAIVDLNETFIYSNKAGEEIFNVQAGGLTNRNLWDFLNNKHVETIIEQSKKRREGIKSKYELEIVTASGEQRFIFVSGAPYYNQQGEFAGTLATFTDITQTKIREREIHRRLKLELIISEISNDFVHLRKEYMDHSVNRAIRKIGSFAEVDRSYIFLFTEDGLFCNNSHEWCSVGIEPQIDNLQGIPISLLPWWMDKLKKYETIHIPLVSNLPQEANAEKEILEAQSVQSLLVIPLVNSDGLIGFLGFDSVSTLKKWQDEDILLLGMLGEIIGNGFGHLKHNEQLIQLNAHLEKKVEEKTKDVINLLELNRAIVDNVGLMVISTDENGTIKSINPFAEKKLGYTASEVVGQFTPMIFHDQSELFFKKKHFSTEELRQFSDFHLLSRLELKENNSSEGSEWVYVTKEGQKINVLLTVSKLTNANGDTTGFVGVAIDITSKKMAEEQLRKSESENKAIIDTVPDIFFKLNREGIYLDYKNSANQLLLADPNVFIGKSIQDILPGDLAQKSMDALDESFTTRKVVQYDYSLFLNNELNFYENRIIAISDVEALSIIRDITERKKIEESLRNTTQNLTILIQNLRAGTLFEDHRRKINMVNQSFCDLFGINMPPEALVGFDCAAASETSKYLMREPDQFIERINEILKIGKTVINDELILEDGRVFERDYIPVLYDNSLIGHLWQYRDITDRKLNEQYAILQRELGFGLAATSSIDQALNLVLQATFSIEGIHAVGVYYIHHPKEELELIVHKGFSLEFIDQVKSYDKSHIRSQIVRKGEPIYGFYDEIFPNSELFASEKLKQIGIIPIKHEGKVIGSVNIASRSLERFSYAAQLSLEMISAQIGGTLARIDAENELKLSQRNFKLMFDTIDDFMFILDIEGRIIKTNPIVSRRLGYTPEELLGMSVLQVHPPERREEAANIVSEMLAGRLDICPVPLCKKNGEFIPVETKVVLGKWDGVDALYGMSRDISERLKAEETLKESEARWHFALEGSGDGVWDWNLKTTEVYFSTQWKTMLGYTESEIANSLEECKKLIHPDDLPKCLSDLDKHLNGETTIYENEHRMRCKDGSYKWILDRGKVLEWAPDGKPVRIIGTHTDITSQKAIESQLRKSINKEKELNDLKSRFVATTSHEFRTPLASILMISDTLILFQHKMDNQQISNRLAKIKDHVMLLTEIVNDVLQLSKMQEGKIGFNPKEEDLILLCKNIIDGFNETIFAKSIIKFVCSKNILNVMVESKLITQAINNLISNAIKYSGAEPDISVKINQDNEEITISIKDNGIGIPEEDQKHLFNPFFRAGNVSTIQGNGLGLCIVQESVVMHGGKVTFNSVFGEGTIFTLHFPLSILIENN